MKKLVGFMSEYGKTCFFFPGQEGGKCGKMRMEDVRRVCCDSITQGGSGNVSSLLPEHASSDGERTDGWLFKCLTLKTWV